MESTASSNSNQRKAFFNDSAQRSVLSASPAFPQLYKQSGDFDDVSEDSYPKPPGGRQKSFDSFDDLGLRTPPHWRPELASRFDGNSSMGVAQRTPSAVGGRNPHLSASLPLPRTGGTGRSQSAPRSQRTRGATNSKFIARSGKSISQKLRSGQLAGKIERWCLAIGPMTKAFDDYPIRIDAQVATVDIVWREKRYEMNGMWRNGDPLSRGASVLRRERFQFDEIFLGSPGVVKLGGNCRQRAVEALQQNIDLCFISLAAGDIDQARRNGSLMEPPMALLLGDQGGQGLISAVVDEIFRYLGHAMPPARIVPSSDSSFGRAAAQSVQMSGVTASVVLSAVMLCNGHISDLLASSSGFDVGGATVRRLQDGRNILHNVGRLRLHSAADFERVAGVLLGRRSALKQKHTASDDGNVYLDTAVAADENACILITISVTGFGLSNGGEGNYHFVCPTSDQWRLPGMFVPAIVYG